jgi:hypothetical protein
MNCNGINLVATIDRMPEGNFPYLFNVRVLEEGRIESRPGYIPFAELGLGDIPNSIRRLNDPDMSYAPAGYIYVGGGGVNLYAGVETNYNVVDYGPYSGNPLSLVTFRPDQSPESWMYVYDALKNVKVRPDGTVRAIGVAPPRTAPKIEYGQPAWTLLTDGSSGTWSNTATAGNDRTNGTTPSIDVILYNQGSTGWACINPILGSGTFFWAGERMLVTLGGTEEIVVREIHPAIANSTIQGIQYDSGVSGPCSLVITGSPANLARNSLIQLNFEVVRVLEVIPDPSGVFYSVRCSTLGTHAAGEPVYGLISWYVWTNSTHAHGEAITSEYVAVPNTYTDTSAYFTINGSTANGRPIDPANDYFHISLFLQNPQFVTSVVLKIDIGDGSFTQDYITYTIPGSELALNGFSPGGDSWTDLSIQLSTGVRTGNTPTASLATISRLQVGIILQMSETSTFGFDSWYFFGTYGPEVPVNAPAGDGVIYQSRFRDSSTGAHSVPGPFNRQTLFPLREEVLVTPATSTALGVDTIDIYRQGGTISTFLYDGSVANTPSAPVTFLDTLPDSFILEANVSPDLAAIQPWPLLGLAWQGLVNVVGTTVTWAGGTQFNLNLLSNSVIEIGGIAYQTYGQPVSPTQLELTSDAGVQVGVTFLVASPTIAGSPLSFAFGPLEGPFSPVVWALGDPINAGTIYFSNFSDADSASDLNSIELTGPSEPLISGAVWNGIVICGSRDKLYRINYSYLTTIGASSNVSYQYEEVPTPSGIWSRWACCATPVGVAFLGRDGIYIATSQGATNITDETLYPLFPHDGTPASAVGFGTDLIEPVDMTRLSYLRLSYCDEAIRFSYLDTSGESVTIIYQIYRKRWFLNEYKDPIWAHYLVEASVNAPNQQEILLLGLVTNEIFIAGGNLDNGQSFDPVVLTPALDAQDERAQKLFIDMMILADQAGTLTSQVTFNYAQSPLTPLNLTLGAPLTQYQQNLASLTDLALHLNIAVRFSWTGGPAGPRLYAWEPSGILQPYLSQRITTQVFGLAFPGWKSFRRLYPGMISNSPVTFIITTDDGRTFTYTLPSTNGAFQILPQMLDQNIKALAFGVEVDGAGQTFALFPDEFTLETKEWSEQSYIKLAVWKA